MLRALLKSASLRTAIVLGLGGVAFTLANLILAKTLRPEEYGIVSLVVGVVAVAGLAAPLGLDLVIGRRGLPLDRRLRGVIASTSIGVGVLAAAMSALVYQLPLALAACVLVITVASGIMQASAAWFQGQQRFGPASWLVQLSNLSLLVAALLGALLGYETALETAALFALAMVFSGIFAWRIIVRATVVDDTVSPPVKLLPEALSLLTIHVSNATFLQLERLLLAPVAGVQALALFGVVSALVASPFRMLQTAVLFTLIPNLRRTAGIRERRRLLRREVLLVTSVISAGWVVIWYVAPPLAHWFLRGRYDLGPALMCAALVSGIFKLCSAFTTGTVIALAEEKGLRKLSVVSWASIGLAIAAAFAAAPWGLVGVLYGISAGWLVRSLAAAWMAGASLADDRRSEGDPQRAAFGDRFPRIVNTMLGKGSPKDAAGGRPQ